MRENAEKELKAIEEKGLTSSNLDNAYKLVEIMKGVDKIESFNTSHVSINPRPSGTFAFPIIP